MQSWDEVRTAAQVARLGTVSGAAEVLGVHHATVIRHIDALEQQLGVKLFQRHARGYTPTEAGRDLLAVAQATQDQFAQLANRIKGQGETVSGELIVTAISGISDVLVSALSGFQQLYPDVSVRFLTDLRVFRLDHGEAHVAIRAGDQPQEADYVVQPLTRLVSGLYAAPAYADAHGLPQDLSDLSQHRFVGAEGPLMRAPFNRWLEAHVPAASIRTRVTEPAAALTAVRAGMGLGFVPPDDAQGLVQALPPQPEWESPLWIVTHVDLHRTFKVQAFLTHLKQHLANRGAA